MSIERRIENAVTDERGYDRWEVVRISIPKSLRNTELGLQIALANMDTIDGKLDLVEMYDFDIKLPGMMKQFKHAGIPLNAVSSRQFREAYTLTPGYLESIYKIHGPRFSLKSVA
ncbi:hypothetical protein KW805_03770 [Candidatus Pacearchaeota archaeon]|nr:hypothetical protein [Candidatus Pacearchaeota archaeon]